MVTIPLEEALRLIQSVIDTFGLDYFNTGCFLIDVEYRIKQYGCYRWNPFYSLDSIKKIVKSLNLSDDVVKVLWFNANWNGKDASAYRLSPLEEDGTIKFPIYGSIDWIPEQEIDKLNLLVHYYDDKWQDDSLFFSEPLIIKAENGKSIKLNNTWGWFYNVIDYYFRECEPHLLKDYPNRESALQAYRRAIKKPKGQTPDNRTNAVIWHFYDLCKGESGRATKELLFAISDYLRLMHLADLDTDNIKARISNFKKMDVKPKIKAE